MSRASKYGIRELHRNFPTNKTCLEFIFDSLHDRRCSCGGVYSLRKGRKKFRCGRCRFEIAPLVGTIFEKSSTPLLLWFHALLLFSNAKSGLSAKQLERHLAVTYKCAWRILREVRSSLIQGLKRLQGLVETDGAYLGGKRKGFKSRSEAILSKPVAFAAIERGGSARAETATGTGGIPTWKFVTKSVHPGSRLFTDKHGSYDRMKKIYKIRSVNHSAHEYVRGNTHVNTVESFWSHIKRSVAGTHKRVSNQHLQSYLNAFVFHYNNRHSDRKRFLSLLGIVLHAGAKKETPSGS
jgi:transposase